MILNKSIYRLNAPKDKIAKYLDSAIATLTRDILLIPATSASVERLFNTTRDIYYYRRGRLNSSTIQELIIYLYATKFDIDNKQSPDQLNVDPISDNEEEAFVDVENEAEREDKGVSKANN
ncbi:uncharacterized protein N7458_003687 [Penicillium daleae]|uniref:HAT C-terminal dimerisation domain-containing protein n=1 Tax=Penicillium daleae TaxID=63821 RepID=A0AAD6CA25_9EURO|nr:uncharacterized protein N7458_003687 [Penicillium daleae]KAJ5456104.1 hypothetical protein N7458_003687 [Penicillium daleae]